MSSHWPERWKGSRLKYESSLKGRLGWQGLNADEYRDEGPYVVSSAHFQSENVQWSQCPRVSTTRYQLDENIQLQPSDILLMKDGAALGKLAFIDEMPGPACLNSHLLLLRPRNRAYEPKYLFYLATTEIFQGYMQVCGTGATFMGVSQRDIGNFALALPSLEEQTLIAKFLDYETARIDALIDKQQQLIALLKEKRQAVISHAVTRGLNPDTPMRDSGIEWLGEVPAHWQVVPTKRFFRLECNPAPKNNDMELISIYTHIGVRPRRELEEKGNKASTTDGYWIVKKGDLIVNKLLAWMGAVGYSDYEGVTSPAYDILRKTRPINPKFYHYLFRLKNAGLEFKRWSRGIMDMRLRLYFEDLGQIQAPLPPEGEQNAIVAYVESMEATFDGLATKAEEQIDLLIERRTALISAAVTGKIDVRGWKTPESETEEETETA